MSLCTLGEKYSFLPHFSPNRCKAVTAITLITKPQACAQTFGDQVFKGKKDQCIM